MSVFPTTSLVILGSEELRRALSDIEPNIQRQYARRALRAGGMPLLAAMRSRIKSRTGLLAGSLKLRAGRGDRKGRTSLLISANVTAAAMASHYERIGRRGKMNELRDRYKNRENASYKVWWARAVEFGHKGPFGSEKATPPHSFARAGFDSTAENAADIIEEKLLSDIESDFAKGQ